MLVRGNAQNRRNDELATAGTFPSPAFSLYSHYNALFETRTADTPSLREECFRIRYEVYCVERRFLDAEQNPGSLERDSYDDRSVHSLLYDRASGLAIGTIRLILAERGSPVPTTPFHHLCWDQVAQRPDLSGLAQTAEVSRLALSKCRCDIASSSNGNKRRSSDLVDVHPNTYVALGLLRMAIEMGVRNRVDYLCAVMEPSLLRMFARCGIYLEPLGPSIEYHGRRQPCYSHLVTMLDGIKANRPDAWEVITDIGRFHPKNPRSARFGRQAIEPTSQDPTNWYSAQVR